MGFLLMNQTLYFNASQFFFKVQSIPEDHLSVLAFSNPSSESKIETREQHGISENYCFIITLHSHLIIDNHTLINKDATLKWNLETGGNQTIHGVITSVQSPKITKDGYEYIIHLHSPLFRLKLHFPARVYIQKNVLDIIDDVLQSAGWSKGTQGSYHIQTSQVYPLLECELQLEKSDFHFVTQLMNRWGLFYYFEDIDGCYRLNIIDDLQFLPKPLPNSLLETPIDPWPCWQLLTHSYLYTDYNSENPTLPLQVQTHTYTELPTEGKKHVYGEHFRTIQEGKQLSDISQQALECQRTVFYATSTYRHLKPGDSVGEYWVINICHQGDQRGAFYGKQSNTALRYQNLLTLLKKGVRYQPKNSPRSYSPAKVGTLETFGEAGSYTFRFPFDTKNPEGLTSPYSHQLQPLSGGGAEVGFHFPNQKGTKVEILFINGDINRPIIAGAHFEGSSNPVTANNAHQHRLLTKSGNELRFDDQPNQEGIVLTTSHQKNFLSLSACPNNDEICLKTMEGTLHLNAGLNASWDTEGDTRVEIGGNYRTTVKNNHQIIANQNIDWQSEKYMHLRAKENMSFIAEQNTCSFNSQENVFFDSDHCHIQFKKHNSVINALQGNVMFKAKHVIQAIANKNIRITQSGASITLNANQLKIDTPGTLKIESQKCCQLQGIQKRA